MKNKIKTIILRILVFAIIAIIGIIGYYFIFDIESTVPEEINSQEKIQSTQEVSVETTQFMSRKVFKILPQNDKKSEKVILYFHGGAYMAEATKEHWDFLKRLSQDTGATIIMPDYPLSPKYTYKDVLNMVEPLYKEVVSEVDSKNLIVMGDSAGGGIALGLSEKISVNGINMPSKIILISPWLDTTMSNPKIAEVQKNDKDLNKEKLYLAGVTYSRGMNKEEDYFVNPINGNVAKLKDITIYTGTYDILNPDCYILQKRAKQVGVDIKIKEYETAPHIWIVNNNDELAKKAYDELLVDVKR